MSYDFCGITPMGLDRDLKGYMKIPFIQYEDLYYILRISP
jgi:hypothetical protein